MPETPEFQKANYPLPVYNFRVTVAGTSMSFTEISGLAIELDTVSYRHGLSFWEGEAIKSYRFPKFVTVTLKKGTVPGIAFLHDWIRERAARNMAVSLCDEKGDPVISWNVARALPVKLEAPSFNAASNEVSIDSLEVLAGGISITHHQP
jgi:phage tail-like protein